MLFDMLDIPVSRFGAQNRCCQGCFWNWMICSPMGTRGGELSQRDVRENRLSSSQRPGLTDEWNLVF